jgi:hypothetical protein
MASAAWSASTVSVGPAARASSARDPRRPAERARSVIQMKPASGMVAAPRKACSTWDAVTDQLPSLTARHLVPAASTDSPAGS